MLSPLLSITSYTGLSTRKVVSPAMDTNFYLRESSRELSQELSRVVNSNGIEIWQDCRKIRAKLGCYNETRCLIIRYTLNAVWRSRKIWPEHKTQFDSIQNGSTNVFPKWTCPRLWTQSVAMIMAGKACNYHIRSSVQVKHGRTIGITNKFNASVQTIVRKNRSLSFVSNPTIRNKSKWIVWQSG